MRAAVSADAAQSRRHGGFGVGRVLPDGAACWSLLLVAVKIGLGIGLLVGLGDGERGTLGSFVQVASYLVVALAIALQRRVGLVLASAFVGYSLASGIAVFGVRIDRVAVLVTSTMLVIALLTNAMWNGDRWLRPTKELAAMVVAGAVLGTVLAPLVSVSVPADGQVVESTWAVVGTADVGFAPTDFIPAGAKAEFASSVAIEDDADIDCVLEALYRSVGLTGLISWSGRDLTAGERARVAGFVDECEQ